MPEAHILRVARTGKRAAKRSLSAPASGDTGHPRQLHRAIFKEGSRLLHAQCWAWGRDIQHPEGNLLLRHGFERLRPPAGIDGSSQYTLVTAHGLMLRLWGFGVYIGREQGIYLNRFAFEPRRATPLDAWAPGLLAHAPRCFETALLCSLMEWIVGYEQWIGQVAGRRYRASTLTGWKGRAAFLPDLAGCWEGLHKAVQQAETANPDQVWSA